MDGRLAAERIIIQSKRYENLIYTNKWGSTRKDIQNARRVIGDGPDWIDRLEAGLKSGAVLPAVGGALLLGSVSQGARDDLSQ